MSAGPILTGCQWRPTWSWQAGSDGELVRTWTGIEYLFSADGQQIVERLDGTYGTGSGGAIFRKAPPPDRPPSAGPSGHQGGAA